MQEASHLSSLAAMMLHFPLFCASRPGRPRVLGGSLVHPGAASEFRYHIEIGRNTEAFDKVEVVCGGTLITLRYDITYYMWTHGRRNIY